MQVVETNISALPPGGIRKTLPPRAAPGSFDERRELAIETEAPEVIERLRAITRRDWENSETLDLSDEGVLADLNKHHQGGAKQLALKSGGKKK